MKGRASDTIVKELLLYIALHAMQSAPYSSLLTPINWVTRLVCC